MRFGLNIFIRNFMAYIWLIFYRKEAYILKSGDGSQCDKLSTKRILRLQCSTFDMAENPLGFYTTDFLQKKLHFLKTFDERLIF